MAERVTVDDDVVGSKPIRHPKPKGPPNWGPFVLLFRQQTVLLNDFPSYHISQCYDSKPIDHPKKGEKCKNVTGLHR